MNYKLIQITFKIWKIIQIEIFVQSIFFKLLLSRMLFIIDGDKPIYELFLVQPQRQIKQLFLLHASLDSVQSIMPKRKQYYLGLIKTQETPIFCYVNATSTKFMLMFNRDARNYLDKKSENTIKDFFGKVNEQLAFLLLNPLYRLKSEIKITSFDDKIKQLAKDYIKPILDRKK